MTKFKTFYAFVPCLFLILSIDQISKFLILTYDNGQIEIIQHFFNLTVVYNTGAAWSMLSGNNIILGYIGLFATAAIIIANKNLEFNRKFNQIIFGAMCGGIMGNVCDRFFRIGVVDFIDINLGFYKWPIFNFADLAICLSVFVYFVVAFFSKNLRI